LKTEQHRSEREFPTSVRLSKLQRIKHALILLRKIFSRNLNPPIQEAIDADITMPRRQAIQTTIKSKHSDFLWLLIHGKVRKDCALLPTEHDNSAMLNHVKLIKIMTYLSARLSIPRFRSSSIPIPTDCYVCSLKS
jgi:hypothetical protein